MVKPVDFANANIIVELGAGTGNVTEGILSRLKEDAKLFVFETNEDFCKDLRHIKDPRMMLLNRSAAELMDFLKEQDIKEVDCVLSSLPLAIFPEQLRESILNAAHEALKPGGLYIQFQYSLQAYKRLKSGFKSVRLSFTPVNIPPAFVYTCIK